MHQRAGERVEDLLVLGDRGFLQISEEQKIQIVVLLAKFRGICTYHMSTSTSMLNYMGGRYTPKEQILVVYSLRIPFLILHGICLSTFKATAAAPHRTR